MLTKKKLELLWDIHEMLEQMTVKKLRKVREYVKTVLHEKEESDT